MFTPIFDTRAEFISCSEDQYLAHAELYEQEDKDSLDSVDGDLVLDLDAVVDEQGHTMSTEDDLGLE